MLRLKHMATIPVNKRKEKSAAMDFGEFSDVSLDTNDSCNFKSCDESISEAEDSGVWSNGLASVAYQEPSVLQDYSEYDDFSDSVKAKFSSSVNELITTGSPAEQEVSASLQSNNLVDEIATPLSPNIGNISQSDESQSESRASELGSDTCTSKSDSADECNSTDSSTYPPSRRNLAKQGSRSSIDELLFDLYDRHAVGSSRHNSICSIDGSSTDCSSLSENQSVKSDAEAGQSQHTFSSLQDYGLKELKEIALDLSNKVVQKNAQLVKCLRNRERHRNRCSKHCDMITAILQAWSSKSSSDAKMKFTIEPAAGDINFDQWKDATKSLARGPAGLPSHFRNKVWLALASNYIDSLQIDWKKVVQFAFNDKCNPDDDALGAQIVKDLHRTGCSSFSGIENEEDRAILQRVLLGYARWNKVTGYCQGFNILAALILNVTNKNEADALKVMVYLVDHMLPKEYFAHNLRALTVDMAVFRNYLSMKLPKLSSHLVKLQQEARDDFTGASVEPPLTNVFTMQWFLTMFATCLPMNTVLKIWDCVMIDGNEILIRTALAIWTKLAKKVIRCKSADEFYMNMGTLTTELSEGKTISAEELIRSVYCMAPIPLPKFSELREKYMYDITPFHAAMNSASHKAAYCEEDSPDYMQELARKQGLETKTHHSMDVALLKKQYSKLTQRQRQAKLLMKGPVVSQSTKVIPSSSTPIAINHLFVGKQLTEKTANVGKARAKEMIRSRSIDSSIRASTPSVSDPLSTRLDLYASNPRGQQTMQYKMRIDRSKASPVKQPEDLESQIMEAEQNGTLVRRCSSASDSSLEEHELRIVKKSETAFNPPVSRQLSSTSTLSRFSTDSVFYHETSPQQTPSRSFTNSLDSSSVSDYFSLSPARKKSYSSSLPVQRAFNPFPKPATGMLSAEKAKVGVKFGLYKHEDALAYVKPSERKNFLKQDKNFIGRIAFPSQSTMW